MVHTLLDLSAGCSPSSIFFSLGLCGPSLSRSSICASDVSLFIFTESSCPWHFPESSASHSCLWPPACTGRLCPLLCLSATLAPAIPQRLFTLASLCPIPTLPLPSDLLVYSNSIISLRIEASDLVLISPCLGQGRSYVYFPSQWLFQVLYSLFFLQDYCRCWLGSSGNRL